MKLLQWTFLCLSTHPSQQVSQAEEGKQAVSCLLLLLTHAQFKNLGKLVTADGGCFAGPVTIDLFLTPAEKDFVI